MDISTLQTIDRDIGLFVAIIRELLSQGLVEETCPEQITLGQVRCLCFVWAQEQVRVGDVSRGLGISYPATTKTVARLVEKGLLARKNDTRDRRNIFVEITPAGRLMVDRIKPAKLKRLDLLLENMTAEDLKHLRRGIEAFLTAAVTRDELFEQVCLHCGREHMETCVLSSLKCRKKQAAVQG